MQAEKERNGARVVFLDLIRTLAIMCVVLCHSVEKIYSLNLEEWNTSSISSNLFKTFFYNWTFGCTIIFNAYRVFIA